LPDPDEYEAEMLEEVAERRETPGSPARSSTAPTSTVSK
jgi:hypothetical protein